MMSSITQDDITFYREMDSELGINSNTYNSDELIIEIASLSKEDFERLIKLVPIFKNIMWDIAAVYTRFHYELLQERNYKYLSWIPRGFSESGDLLYEVVDSYDSTYDHELKIPGHYILSDNYVKEIFDDCQKELEERRSKRQSTEEKVRQQEIELLKQLKEKYPEE